MKLSCVIFSLGSRKKAAIACYASADQFMKTWSALNLISHWKDFAHERTLPVSFVSSLFLSLSICLSVCLYVCLCVCLSTYLSVCLCLGLCLYIYLCQFYNPNGPSNLDENAQNFSHLCLSIKTFSKVQHTHTHTIKITVTRPQK